MSYRDFQPIPDEENKVLLSLVRQNDQKAKERMILGNIALALLIAKRYSLRVYKRSPDIVAEAMFAVTKAVDSISKGALDKHIDPNPRGYIIRTVKGRLGNYISKDRIFGMTISAYIRREAKGQEERKSVTFLDLNQYDLQGLCTYDNLDSGETLKLISDCTINKREKEIVDLLAQDLKDVQIADILNLSKARVGQIRHTIRNRIQEKLHVR